MRRALDYGHLPAPAVPLAFLLAAPWSGATAGLLATACLRLGVDLAAPVPRHRGASTT